MNKQQFTQYISENFDCSNEAANAVIEIFAESVYLAILEGYEVNLDHFGKFAVRNISTPKQHCRNNITELGELTKSKKIITKRAPYFTPAPDFKFAFSY
jgi:nucleoid DNA-binding protein